MPNQHASASTSRRGSGNGKPVGAGGGGGGVTSTGNHANRARMDATLRMSSKATNDDAAERTHHVVASHARNKSSDRLHRLAAGHSSGNLASHGAKRSKSYSQIMTATGEKSNGASARKNKLRRERSDGHPVNDSAERADAAEVEEVVVAEEDGWTSADQTSSDSRATRSKDEDSEYEDEDIVLFGKKKVASTKDVRPDVVGEATGLASAPHQHHSTEGNPASSKSGEEPAAKIKAPEESSKARGKSNAQETDKKEQGSLSMSRLPSTSSVRTLTSSGTLTRNESRDVPASPSTIASVNHRTSLMPRASHVHVVPPKLSTEYAFAGPGNGLERQKHSLHRSSESDVGALTASASDVGRFAGDRSTDSVPQYRFSTIDSGMGGASASDFQIRARKTSISSARSSIINLPGVSPSLGTISHDKANAESTGAQTSRAIEAMQRATLAGMRASQSSLTLNRERTVSTQSSGPTEAARLANKLRMTRSDSVDTSATSSPVQSTSASRLLANSGTKYFSGNKADGSTVQAMAKYNKPTISVFVRRQDDFKSIEKHVEPGNLFDERFARASLSGQDHSHSSAKASHGEQDGDKSVTPARVRYLMDYGLSGPALEKNTSTKALLSTCLDNDEFEASWAPALTQAAGLGDSNDRQASGLSSTAYAGMAAGDSVNGLGNGLGGGVFINGPNATPLHFLHGLTNTNDSAFPLDEADVGVVDGATGMIDRPSHGEYVDAKNLRAVALTWAALNTTKNHVMTRRYVDPMRESLERVMEAAGRGVDSARSRDEYGGVSSDSLFSGRSGHAGSAYRLHEHRTPNVGSGANTPGGSLRWGWRSLFADQTPHE